MDLVNKIAGSNGRLKEQDMEVDYVLIGAGLPRTGTASTCTAREILLPGKCHHMQRAHSGKGDAILWPKAKSGEARETDWREFIKSEGLSASVDYPMSLYWRDL